MTTNSYRAHALDQTQVGYTINVERDGTSVSGAPIKSVHFYPDVVHVYVDIFGESTLVTFAPKDWVLVNE